MPLADLKTFKLMLEQLKVDKNKKQPYTIKLVKTPRPKKTVKRLSKPRKSVARARSVDDPGVSPIPLQVENDEIVETPHSVRRSSHRTHPMLSQDHKSETPRRAFTRSERSPVDQGLPSRSSAVNNSRSISAKRVFTFSEESSASTNKELQAGRVTLDRCRPVNKTDSSRVGAAGSSRSDIPVVINTNGKLSRSNTSTDRSSRINRGGKVGVASTIRQSDFDLGFIPSPPSRSKINESNNDVDITGVSVLPPVNGTFSSRVGAAGPSRSGTTDKFRETANAPHASRSDYDYGSDSSSNFFQNETRNRNDISETSSVPTSFMNPIAAEAILDTTDTTMPRNGIKYKVSKVTKTTRNGNKKSLEVKMKSVAITQEQTSEDYDSEYNDDTNDDSIAGRLKRKRRRMTIKKSVVQSEENHEFPTSQQRRNREIVYQKKPRPSLTCDPRSRYRPAKKQPHLRDISGFLVPTAPVPHRKRSLVAKCTVDMEAVAMAQFEIMMDTVMEYLHRTRHDPITHLYRLEEWTKILEDQLKLCD